MIGMADATRQRDDVIRFETGLVSVGDRLILRLPPEASGKLPSRGQVAVTGRMNDHAFETVVEPDGMRGHWIDAAAAAGTGAGARFAEGDVVTVEIERNDAWPEPQVPSEFEAALVATPAAGDTWADITPMARWEWVRWVNATKNPRRASAASR
jgi:hypothetical protein